MSAIKKGSESVRRDGTYNTLSTNSATTPLFSMGKIKELVAELEVPFNPSLIEWKVTSTNQDESRGLLMPYADPRAYTDRLNEILTPAGWTRRYVVTTSANFERNEDKKLVAKVFVTCDLTIHGIGSHSATGEEWADNDNAGTSAEAQAFKRACSCFGLGRYLYYFTGVWMDLDERRRFQEAPEVMGWATPNGWRSGLRPVPLAENKEPNPTRNNGRKAPKSSRRHLPPPPQILKLIQQVEAMAEPLGRKLYRGLLKSVANVWKPSEIRNVAVLEKILITMQAAERDVARLETARQSIGSEGLATALRSLRLKSVDQVNSLESLQRLVKVLEEKVGSPGEP
jgi:hypothetical protein